MTEITKHIGLDDTDSTRRGCTTYIAAVLVEKLTKLGATFVDYPSLVRLNPNVPWKTRGNGALCLRISHDDALELQIKEAVVSTVEKHSDLENKGTDPGVVFFNSARMPREIRDFAQNTITGISKIKDAKKLLRKYGGEAVAFKDGRGIIGALAAVGETFQSDHTFEVIAYRTPENYGTKRRVDETSILEMDKATKPNTFNNVDEERRRVIITPRGPDPILFGIRGESPEVVKNAFQIVKALEPVERWVVFRTNQGTDAHLRRVKELSQIRPYSSIIAKGSVSTPPRMIRGKHVIFSIKDLGSEVDCAAYEPTGVLRSVARKLIVGDQVEVYGGVRPGSSDRPLTINLEKIRLIKPASQVTYRNPVCLKCGARLKSMGKDKGFRCDKCRARYPTFTKTAVRVKRDVIRGLYMTSTRSQRHLTKPSSRYGMEKHRRGVESLVDEWHFP
jgi:tRNA(Ile2)-agmatinylcytidine synthase